MKLPISRFFISLLLLLVIPNAAPVLASEPIGRATFRPTPVTPNPSLTFPRDHGAHPAIRTEWWYATGHLQTASGKPFGFQVTFFRSRTGVGEGSPSKFAPSQILFAHAAIADPELGKLRHDERIARAGFGNFAKTGAMDVKLEQWTMQMSDNLIHTKIPAKDFTLDLKLGLTKPPLPRPLLQGESGYSRKGPASTDASYYLSLPQLAVSGDVMVNGKTEAVTGVAWFDHEWSSDYLASDAVGWDWLGANFADGGAMMAFQMRGKNGSLVWASGTRVFAGGQIVKYGRDAVRFTTINTWKSPRTGATWPVSQTLSIGDEMFALKPWFNDQELDSSRSTGIIYWEGAADVLRENKPVAKGYLELTGYAKPIKF